MCTAITLKTSDNHYFLGRTMDFSYPLDPSIYIVPKNYKWDNILNTCRFQNDYSFIGIGQDISPVVFADGVNEKGFAAASLYFPGYASYDSFESGEKQVQGSSGPSVAAIELVRFLLSFCSSIQEAASLLQTVQIVGTTDAVTNSVAPLHWITADSSGSCMVIEKTRTGLHLWNNPVGVLSNSPDFSWHMTNLRNYMNIQPVQTENQQWSSVDLSPFGQGAGTFGLPGDYTPPSRFVRAAYLKSHIVPPETWEEGVLSGFHIMENLSLPKGAVITSRNTVDYTQYKAFINLSTRTYYFSTYNNPQILSASLSDISFNGADLVSLGKLQRPAAFTNIKN